VVTTGDVLHVKEGSQKQHSAARLWDLQAGSLSLSG
jgi:hypothetical protein